MANKKNGGIIPPLPLRDGKPDERVMYVPVGCGKCMECKKKKSREWQVRLLEEVKHDKKGVFVTLTFNTESLRKLSTGIHKLEGYERDNEIAKIAVRKFLERWRKKNKKSVKHWLVTELGHEGTEHMHMHGIIWTEKEDEIQERWGYGNVWLPKKGEGYISERTVNYITKYVNKTDQKHKYYEPIILTSAGIGKEYIGTYNNKRNKYKKEEKTNEAYENRQGYKMAMPIYYRNNTYSEEEREKLWIEKLDEKVRYVDGVKIDISESEESYYKVLEEAREKNERLGFGNNKINWDRKKYENERRNIIHKERIEIKKEKEIPKGNIEEAF